MDAFPPPPSTIVVLSLLTTMRLALPRSASCRFSSLMPRSSAIILPPVRVAMSSSIALRRSPNPGARTAQALSEPRSLLTTSVASASPSSSSAMMSNGLPAFATCSSTGKRSFIPEIFFSWMRTYASSNTVSMRSGSVTKYGERYPRSNCMPSTTSSVVSRPFASSTVMTPSLPTLAIASAMMLPMVLSPLAEMLPTRATSISPRVGLESFFSASTTAATALSMPRLIAIGSLPAATSLLPSRKMACASTVAVVVPSPAMSEVREATSFTICAPMFSNRSCSTTALATVTPSLVMSGAPKDCSSTTLRPLGPSVTLTASVSVLTPLRIASRARTSNRICLAMDRSCLSRTRCSAATRSGVGGAVDRDLGREKTGGLVLILTASAPRRLRLQRNTRRYSLDQLLHVLRMGARYEHYRWWLLDGDLEIVSDGRVAGASLLAALADLSRQIDRLGDHGRDPTNQPYRLIVYKGAAVVAVRPATLGIC